MSSHAFALVTDYTCTLSKNGQVTNLSVNALISRIGAKNNGEYSLMATNNLGDSLEVVVYAGSSLKILLLGAQKLAGSGYVNGDQAKGERGQSNPTQITFNSDDKTLAVNCTRADNIEYPKN